ncbi:MAG: phosphate ABC transporter ATP-binding protein PstB [Candidatus Sumerlaeia bacterium]|nr:phosphate ABC transporter ATP-binding protein PstB [Candidatus Sumerlaeia bacterium]
MTALAAPHATPGTQEQKHVSEPPLLRVDKLDFYYGEKQALFGIELDIHQGEVHAMIGPSGCGKSTLIKCFNRIAELNPIVRTQGRILFRGRDILAPGEDLITLRTQIGMVFQRPNPFPKSIYENIAYGLRLHGVKDKATIDDVVEWSLRRSALWGEVHNRLKSSALALSGGQQQRLCIARALAVQPDVLLMDEPCSALDPIATARIEELIIELKYSYTIVIVTHNMQQAVRVSSKTTFLYLGEIIETGDTKQVFNAPVHKRTKDYVAGEFS